VNEQIRTEPLQPPALVDKRWAVLAEMDRPALRVDWTDVFGRPPPHHFSMPFMRKALIWHAQCRVFGGLSSETKRSLKSALSGTGVAPVVSIQPGAQLIREWNGRTYHVDVVADGFVLNGERFKSLSAVALHITGTAWSGPRFFGLKDNRGRP